MNKELLAVAKGLKPADLVVTNGKIVNVYSGEIYDGGVAVCGDTIAAVGDVAYCIGDGTKVTAQIPAGGSQLAKNTGRVIFYTGAETPTATVTVPDVMGKSATAANKMLIDAGLNVRIDGTQNYQSGSGAVVVAQSPAAYTAVAPGTIVTVEFRYLDGTD